MLEELKNNKYVKKFADKFLEILFLPKTIKILKILAVICIVVVVSGNIAVTIVNNNAAKDVEERLRKLPLPENAELVDSVSQAGKVTNHANGMQYYGAILIKSDLTLNELRDFYAKKSKYEGDCIILKHGEHELDFASGDKKLGFGDYSKKAKHYYIIYSWGQGPKHFENMDLRGRIGADK